MVNIYDPIPARRKRDSTNLMGSNINKTGNKVRYHDLLLNRVLQTYYDTQSDLMEDLVG